jgi:hypothetical protein
MRRFVRSERWLGTAIGVLAFLIIWLTQATGGMAYLIVAVLTVIGSIVLIWPERAQLWRGMRDRHLPRRPKR